MNGTDIAQVDGRIHASALSLERTGEVMEHREAALGELKRRADAAEADYVRMEQVSV